MAVYALVNSSNSLPQLNFECVPFGPMGGTHIDNVYEVSKLAHLKKQVLQENDLIVTTSVANFSTDTITALEIIRDLVINNKVRVYATLEDFDTNKPRILYLLDSIPLLHTIRRNSFKAKRKRLLEGIEKAKKAGKYSGRQAIEPTDFPKFVEYYKSYMRREIGKVEFAKKLGVSRPTLDRLLEKFEQTKG